VSDDPHDLGIPEMLWDTPMSTEELRRPFRQCFVKVRKDDQIQNQAWPGQAKKDGLG
jgi:hypothetical protein